MTIGNVDVVDDSAAHRKLFGILLSGAGYTPRMHATAAAVLAAAGASPPRLVVADVQLPGSIDGLMLARALKAAPATAHVPVLVVSAFASAQDEDAARRAGADGWLSKPIDTRDFVALVRALDPTGGADVDVE